MKTVLVVVIGFVVIGIGGFFLVGSTKEEQSLKPIDTPVLESPVDTQILEVSLEATEYKFSPSDIKVKPGQSIRLSLVNKGQMQHDFVLGRWNVTTPLVNPGQTEIMEFKAPPDSGSYEFYCSVGNHRALGMKGTLIVE